MEFKHRCFVLMPFVDKYKEVYEQVYKPVCDSNSVFCWRVDEISRPGSITRDIVDGIIDADIIIADLTSRNANVFYELGIAHSVGNKTIMLAQSKDDVPFDIANYRVILYEQSISGSRKLSSTLDQAIKELLARLDQTNNPVQEVFSTRSVGGIRRKVPIVQVVDFGSLRKAVRDVISGENIRYVDDLRELNLDEIKTKYKLGSVTLSVLVQIMLVNNAYKDLKLLQEFSVKNRLHTSTKKY